MITLTKSGNAIVFTFDDNDHYLNDGTIEVPVNSLTLVTDDSQMATFKRSSTNDIFISARYDELGMSKSDLESWFKENAFDTGGVTEEEVQDMIDESVSGLAESSAVTEEISAAVSGKADSSAVTEEISAAVSGKADTTAVTASINSAVSGKMDTSAFNTYSASTDARLSEDEEVTSAALNELNDALDDKADTTAVTASIAAAVSGKQDTLSAGTNITISGNVISAEGGANVVQTTGSSSADVMSQSAVTTQLNDKYNRFYLSGIFDEQGFQDGRTDLYGTKRLTTNLIFEASSINGKQVLNQRSSASNKFDLVETSAITTSVTSASTDSQVPSAKAVYDALQEGGSGGGKAIVAGRGIAITTGETADTVSFDLPLSASTDVYSLTDIALGNNLSNETNSHNLKIGKNLKISGGTHYAIGISHKTNNSNDYSILKGDNSVGLGYFTIDGDNAIGIGNVTVKRYGAAIGYASNAKDFAVAIGLYSNANGIYSTALSRCTTNNNYEFGCGAFNKSVSGSSTWGDSGNTLFAVGDGTSTSNRHNAFEIRQNGDIYITKDGSDVKLQDQLGGGGLPESAFTAYTAATDARLAEDEEVTAAALNALDDAIDDKADASDLGGLKLVQLTQAQYEALTTKDASTLYIITSSN